MKKRAILSMGGMLVLGFCAGITITFLRPWMEELKTTKVFTDSHSPRVVYESGSLSWLTPEIENVVKNGSGDIVNITLKRAPVYLPSDSLFINENDAVPLSDVLIDNTIHLAKLWPKFETLLKRDTVDLEVCRTTDCTNKLVLKIPQNATYSTGNTITPLAQKEEIPAPKNETSTGWLQIPQPTAASIPQPQIWLSWTWELALLTKTYTPIGNALYTDNDDLKTLDGNIDGNYSGTLDKSRWFTPKNGSIVYKTLGDTLKYKNFLYILQVKGDAFFLNDDMYLLNFNGESRWIKYSLYDKAGKIAKIFVNNGIHTLPNIFSKNKNFSIVLQTEPTQYTISIYSQEGEKLWMGVWKQNLWWNLPLYIGSKNWNYPFQGSIFAFSVYGK